MYNQQVDRHFRPKPSVLVTCTHSHQPARHTAAFLGDGCGERAGEAPACRVGRLQNPLRADLRSRRGSGETEYKRTPTIAQACLLPGYSPGCGPHSTMPFSYKTKTHWVQSERGTLPPHPPAANSHRVLFSSSHFPARRTLFGGESEHTHP